MSDDEMQFLEDNIATVAFHLGQPGARLNISHDKSRLGVDPGEVLQEISRRLTRDRAQGEPDPDAMNDKRLLEDMTLAYNARKAAIEECAQLIESGAGMADLIDQDELDQQAKYIRALSTPSTGKQADDDGHAFRKNPHSEADFCALCRRPENLHRNRSTHPSTTRGTGNLVDPGDVDISTLPAYKNHGGK